MSTMAIASARSSVLDRQTLVQAILDLEKGHPARIPDPYLACQLALYVKPYIDSLTRPNGGFTAEREAEEAAEEIPQRLAIRSRSSLLEGPAPELSDLPGPERARWIFLDRFISLEKHQEILRYEFARSDFARYQEDLERFLDNLLMLPDVVEATESNDIPALQRIFASTLLLFRNPFIGDEEGHPIPCTLEHLRQCYPAYFYRRSKTSNWYESYAFYREPMRAAHWSLCDVEYLNCTLRRPERKLASYAKQWHLPIENVQQKTVLEEIYDRIVSGEALGENLFEKNCSSCTSTHYRQGEDDPVKTVFVVQKNQRIAIHGKVGIPHWKATRRLWPGVFPAIVFP